MKQSRSVLVVGGGLAGAAAALAIRRNGAQVTLLESRSRLGGRTGSFVDANQQSNANSVTEESANSVDDCQAATPARAVDYCQHVGMGCCTNLRQFIAWLDQESEWSIERTLHFFGPRGEYRPLGALPLLPAPLHIAHWPARWPGLGLRERLGIARCMWRINRLRPIVAHKRISALAWLQDNGQNSRSIESFWSTIVVSALGESLSRVSLAAVHKVLQDGFMAHREAYHLLVPKLPLDELFNRRVQQTLRAAGVDVRLSTAATSIHVASDDARPQVEIAHQTLEVDHLVVAVPWHQFARLISKTSVPALHRAALQAVNLESSPVTGIHTWWDRAWLELPHAAIVGRLCQWVFPRPTPPGEPHTIAAHYYQIVISATRSLPLGNQLELANLLCTDLQKTFPAVRASKLLRLKVVRDPRAVFSLTPSAVDNRPEARLTARVLLAGDWTQTGWPATMEGAIISGFAAAQSLLQQWGLNVDIVRPPLGSRRSTQRAWKHH